MNSKTKEALHYAGLVLDGVDLLASVLGGGLPVDTALAAAKSIVEALQNGANGKLDGAEVISHLASFEDALNSNNAAADLAELLRYNGEKKR